MTTKRVVAIASATDAGLDSPVSAHFGRCPFFTLVRLEGGHPVATAVIANPAAQNHQPGQIPNFIRAQGADIIIAGGMGRRAVELFAHFGVEVASGASGLSGQALQAWLDGSLTGAVPCRQSEEHHAEGHHHHHHEER